MGVGSGLSSLSASVLPPPPPVRTAPCVWHWLLHWHRGMPVRKIEGLLCRGGGGGLTRSHVTIRGLPPPPSDPDLMVGKKEILQKEVLIWLFLVHKLLDFLGSRTPPPLQQNSGCESRRPPTTTPAVVRGGGLDAHGSRSGACRPLCMGEGGGGGGLRGHGLGRQRPGTTRPAAVSEAPWPLSYAFYVCSCHNPEFRSQLSGIVKPWYPPPSPLWLLEAPVRKIILQMHTPARTSQCWGRQTPTWTRRVRLDAAGQRHG